MTASGIMQITFGGSEPIWAFDLAGTTQVVNAMGDCFRLHQIVGVAAPFDVTTTAGIDQPFDEPALVATQLFPSGASSPNAQTSEINEAARLTPFITPPAPLLPPAIPLLSDRRSDQTSPSSIAALNAVQRGQIAEHISPCWRAPPDWTNLVTFRVHLILKTDAAGMVVESAISPEDSDQRLDSPDHRAADSAQRAALAPDCADIPLPEALRGRPQTIDLIFKPVLSKAPAVSGLSSEGSLLSKSPAAPAGAFSGSQPSTPSAERQASLNTLEGLRPLGTLNDAPQNNNGNLSPTHTSASLLSSNQTPAMPSTSSDVGLPSPSEATLIDSDSGFPFGIPIVVQLIVLVGVASLLGAATSVTRIKITSAHIFIVLFILAFPFLREQTSNACLATGRLRFGLLNSHEIATSVRSYIDNDLQRFAALAARFNFPNLPQPIGCTIDYWTVLLDAYKSYLFGR